VPQTPLGELAALPQTPELYLRGPTSKGMGGEGRGKRGGGGGKRGRGQAPKFFGVEPPLLRMYKKLSSCGGSFVYLDVGLPSDD